MQADIRFLKDTLAGGLQAAPSFVESPKAFSSIKISQSSRPFRRISGRMKVLRTPRGSIDTNYKKCGGKEQCDVLFVPRTEQERTPVGAAGGTNGHASDRQRVKPLLTVDVGATTETPRGLAEARAASALSFSGNTPSTTGSSVGIRVRRPSQSASGVLFRRVSRGAARAIPQSNGARPLAVAVLKSVGTRVQRSASSTSASAPVTPAADGCSLTTDGDEKPLAMTVTAAPDQDSNAGRNLSGGQVKVIQPGQGDLIGRASTVGRVGQNDERKPDSPDPPHLQFQAVPPAVRKSGSADHSKEEWTRSRSAPGSQPNHATTKAPPATPPLVPCSSAAASSRAPSCSGCACNSVGVGGPESCSASGLSSVQSDWSASTRVRGVGDAVPQKLM